MSANQSASGTTPGTASSKPGTANPKSKPGTANPNSKPGTASSKPGIANPKTPGGKDRKQTKAGKKRLEQKVNRRVGLAKKSGILDLSASPNFCFDFAAVPSIVFSTFALGDTSSILSVVAEAKVEEKETVSEENSAVTLPAQKEQSKLRQLWLSRNLITALSFQIAELPFLTTLCLSHNHLSSIPPEVGSLRLLERLLLDGNKLTGLPVEIVKLERLQEIRLSDNAFPMFPSEIIRLPGLIRVGLSGNNIENVPGSIKYLKNLIELDLDYNRLSDLPDTMSRLAPTLQQLGLSHNHFSKIPHCVNMLPNLVVLRLHGNRSAEYEVQDKESGIVLEDQHIPLRHDGYLELRSGHTIIDPSGKEEHIVKKLEGYLEDSFLQNRENADWVRREEEFEAIKVLRARAKRKPWKTENRLENASNQKEAVELLNKNRSRVSKPRKK
jgi:Leucine-rich repeat (LRR) protein